MADDGDPSLSHPRLQELLALDSDVRGELVAAISAKGYEPGCWLSCEDSDLTHTVAEVRETLESLTALDSIEGTLGEVQEFDGEHAWQPPEVGQRGWVILSQSCDLIRDVAIEPFAQLALLREAPADLDLPSLWRKSARIVPLDPTGKRSRHFVDLRSQAFLPKHLLPGHDVRQAIPADSDFPKRRPRTRFALRVGQRYSRMGIPTPIVLGVVEPLERVLTKNKAMRKLFDASFAECLLQKAPKAADPMRLILVTPHETDSEAFRDVEDVFLGSFLEGLPAELADRLDLEGCHVVSLDNLLMTTWLQAWKLDFDFLTFGSKGDPLSPGPAA